MLNSSRSDTLSRRVNPLFMVVGHPSLRAGCVATRSYSYNIFSRRQLEAVPRAPFLWNLLERG